MNWVSLVCMCVCYYHVCRTLSSGRYVYMHESSADPGEAYKYTTCKLHDIFLILKVEKDMVESQLRKSQAFIASLQAQTQKNREKATKAEGR